MATEFGHHMISGIVKWELQRAPKGLFAAVHGKDRPARDNALNALTDRIVKRFESYTIISHVQRDQSDMGRLAEAPDHPGHQIQK